jgi:predicted metalloprotease with PDZ domain
MAAVVALVAVSLPAAEAMAAEPGWLGVMLQAGHGGVKILKVIDDSPAERAGVRAGDVVLELDGRPVTAANQLVEKVEQLRPGDNLQMRVRRGDETLELTVTLAERPVRRSYQTVLNLTTDADPDHDLQAHWTGDWVRMPDDRLENVFVLRLGSPRAHLGVGIQELSDGLRGYFGVAAGSGVLVSEVHEGTPAAEAGLKAGDVMVELGGEAISSQASLLDRLRELQPGQQTSVLLVRDRRQTSVDVTLGERRDSGLTWTDEDHESGQPAFSLQLQGDFADAEDKLREALLQWDAGDDEPACRYELLLDAQRDKLEELKDAGLPGVIEVHGDAQGCRLRLHLIRDDGKAETRTETVIVGEPVEVDLERFLEHTVEDDGI